MLLSKIKEGLTEESIGKEVLHALEAVSTPDEESKPELEVVSPLVDESDAGLTDDIVIPVTTSIGESAAGSTDIIYPVTSSTEDAQKQNNPYDPTIAYYNELLRKV